MIPDVLALVASLPAALGTCYLRHAEEVVQGGRLQALILRVVVVDDSEVVRRGICHILYHKLRLRSSAKLRTEPMPSARFWSTVPILFCWI
jgi:hypothetical protein